MQFIHPILTWAFFLALVPLLIHLINLMRHRRVKWAAMEFLLQSYKKHRRWIWLKQLLLLLCRMAVIALLVAMLAQLVTRDQWSSFFGGKTTHHYVILDDSYSMSDRAGGTSAFDRAKQVVGRIAAGSDGTDSLQKLTLIRFSQAARTPVTQSPGEASEVTGQIADLNAVTIDADFEVLLEEKRRAFDVTELATTPHAALHLSQQLVENASDEHSAVYVVSDFREQPWGNPVELRTALTRLQEDGAEVHLVRCVDSQRPNLAITQLEAAEGTRAAGVPLLVNVKVKNFGPRPAEQVQLKVSSTYFSSTAATGDADAPQARVDELPTVLIDRIAPGETAARQVQVYFPTAGQHVVEAHLPLDAVAADNKRSTVLDLPAAIPVLMLDGDPQERNAYYLNTVFQPGGRTTTGIRPSVQPLAYLRDATPETLREYEAIYLLDPAQLDPRSVSNLEAYVREGGGLAIFLGPESNVPFLNEWYQDGQGLFPIRLQREDLLGSNLADEVPDLQVEDHALFRVLLGKRNPFVRGIRIQQYLKSAADWSPPADSTIEVLARLRNREPLVVERRYGDGRVVSFLTTAAPLWNNWAREPSFVVVVLQLHSYLAAPRREPARRLVGSPIDLQIDGAEFRPEAVFALPGSPRQVVEKVADPAASPDATILSFSLGRAGANDVATGETDRSGIYDVRLLTLDGDLKLRRYALNTDPVEGDLALVDTVQLAESLEPLRVQIHEARDVEYEMAQPSGFPWSQVFLFGLIGLLMGEQALAYSASYHLTRGGAR